MSAIPVRRAGAAKRKEGRAAFLFLFPQFSLLFILMVFPLLFSLAISFTDWDFISGFQNIRFNGVENFVKMWSDVKFVVSFKNTILYALIVVPVSLAVSLFLAIVLNRPVFFRGIFRVVYFLPYVTSVVAISIVWGYIFGPTSGPLNMFLKSLGILKPPGWLSDPKWALPTLMIISVWQSLGYCIVIFMAGLQGIPRELYEAAEIDGASQFGRFRHVTLPMLSPTMFFLLITRVIQSFQIFTPVNVMTHGGPGYSSYVLVFYIYVNGFSFSKMGYASAVSWLMFLMIMAVTLVQWRGQKKWVNY